MRLSMSSVAAKTRAECFDASGTTRASTDEAFSADLTWVFSPLLAGAERGDTMFDFVPISEAEAERIVTRIRQTGKAAE